MADECKRYRNVNYTRAEVFELLQLVAKRKEILDSKAIDAKMSKYKTSQWDMIETEYNIKNAIKRTAKELRHKYDSLKKDARKNAANGRQLQKKVGISLPMVIMPSNSITFEADSDFVQCEQSPSATSMLETFCPNIVDFALNGAEGSRSSEGNDPETGVGVKLRSSSTNPPVPRHSEHAPHGAAANHSGDGEYTRSTPLVEALYAPSSPCDPEPPPPPPPRNAQMEAQFAREKHDIEMQIKRAQLASLNKDIALKDLEIQIKTRQLQAL